MEIFGFQRKHFIWHLARLAEQISRLPPHASYTSIDLFHYSFTTYSVTDVFFSSSSILQMAIFYLVKDAPRKPALCHLSGCLKSAALCQWPQSRAAEQPLGEVQGPSVTHVLLAGGQPRLLRLCFLEKRKKKGEGRKRGGGASTESMQRALIESPTAFAISGAYQAREQTAMLAEQREQRVNSHHVGIDCRISSFQRQRQSRAEYPARKKRKSAEVFLQCIMAGL